jgi:DNA-binding HxlR family transcriptional regulator
MLAMENNNCSPGDLLAVRDALEVLNGPWKLQILISLLAGKKRFKEISREIPGISDKMLSKDLKSLEENHLVIRTVLSSFPPTVEYSVTAHTETLGDVISSLMSWGHLHREKVIGKKNIPSHPLK